LENNKYKVDETKITLKIDPNEKFLLEKIVMEDIISLDVYSLIYDSKCDIQKINYRTIQFFEEMVEDNNLYSLVSEIELLKE